MAEDQINREELRSQVRKMSGVGLLSILDRAMDLLQDSQLPRLVEGYISLDRLRPRDSTPTGLVETVEVFYAASRRGDYYESFDVNSKNCTQLSRGTQVWIVECRRLLNLALEAEKTGNIADASRALSLLMDLLRRVDEEPDEILFFADEGGAWEVGVDWTKILPVWFRCLASTADAKAYAEQVTAVIDTLLYSRRDAWLQKACAAATPEQQEAIRRE